MFKIIFNLFLLILPLFGKKIPIEEIYLEGLITNPKQEISGMDWYNDNLFFLPENLGGHLFMISKNEIKKQISLKNKKPITPSSEEIKINPSSRSAKLRFAVKINNECNFEDFINKFKQLTDIEDLPLDK